MFSFSISLVLTQTWGIGLLFKKSASQIRSSIEKNTLCTLYLKRWGFHAKPVFFFNKLSGDLYFVL